MKKLSRMSKTKKTILAIILILVFLLLLLYYIFWIYSTISKNFFVDQAIEISDKNQKPVFKIQKIMLYSSAGAIDNSQDKSLKDLDISQFTDIAIYIDNTSYVTDLTQENTVKSIYISDISISKDNNIGIKSLTYKNPLNFAKFEITDAAKEYTAEDTKYAPINYNVLYDNQTKADYIDPTFYTDCSDPITLTYINKDVSTHYSLPDNSNVTFNGALLKQANVSLNDLATDLSFNVNIINNQNESFIYNIKLNLKYTSDIYAGYMFQGKTTTGNEFNFFKE